MKRGEAQQHGSTDAAASCQPAPQKYRRQQELEMQAQMDDEGPDISRRHAGGNCAFAQWGTDLSDPRVGPTRFASLATWRVSTHSEKFLVKAALLAQKVWDELVDPVALDLVRAAARSRSRAGPGRPGSHARRSRRSRRVGGWR